MLYYNKKGKGKTVLFLHGFLETSDMWNYFQEELSKEYCVVCIDLPGHGRSAGETQEVNRMEYMAEKIDEVLVFLKIEEAIIIGHSMGGYVALAYADIYPHKVLGLGLFYSTALPDGEAKKEQRLKAAELVVKNPQDFFRLSIPLLFAKANLAKLKEEVKIAISWANQASITGISAALKGMRLRPDRVEIVKELNKPVLVVTGEYDNSVKIVDLKKAIEDCHNVTFYELPTGHMGALEAPKESLNIIKNWLKDNFS